MNLGVRIAIDDFGTGYSNLTRLRDLPLHTLKLDAALVRPAPAGNHGCDAFLSTVVDLGHTLGLTVTAEGIGTDAHAERMRAAGCDTGQGWHLGPAAARAPAVAARQVTKVAITLGWGRGPSTCRPDAVSLWYATTTCQSFFNGGGTFDEMIFPTKGRRGMILRLFDIERGQWSIYWADSRTGLLGPPVVGTFAGGRGDFYGDDTHEGQPIRAHFTWSDNCHVGPVGTGVLDRRWAQLGDQLDYGVYSRARAGLGPRGWLTPVS